MISVCPKSVEKRCETERVGHMVSKKDDEGRILVVEEEKKKAKKIHDRTYDIIMSEKPQRRFHFRYVVYTAGLLIGLKMLYKHNESLNTGARRWRSRTSAGVYKTTSRTSGSTSCSLRTRLLKCGGPP